MEYKWVVLTVTAVGTLMSGINMRVVVIGLPTIATALGADLETALWVTQAYQLLTTVGLLVVGRITDMFGRVKIYNLGFVIFTIGSALCSLSQNGVQLIVFRLLQGAGAAMLIANSIALITDATPLQQLGFAIGINQILFRVGSVLGLTLGGALIELTGWRSVFYMNVPVGIFGTLWAYIRLKETSGKRKNRERFDLWGFFAFITALGSLLLSTTFATMNSSLLPFATLLAALSAVSFVLFIFQERRTDDPLLDLRLFSERLFAAGNGSLFFYGLSMGSVTLIMSLYLQVVRGYGPLEAGLMFVPMEVTFAIAGPLSGNLSDRYGSRGLTTTGMGVIATGLFLLSGVSATTSYLEIGIVLGLVGIGLGLFVAPNWSSVMRSVPAQRRGVASAIRATMFNSSSVISVSFVAAMLVTELPYSTASAILSGTVATVSAADQAGFLIGVREALLASGILSLIGVIPSAVKGSSERSVTS